MSATDPTDSTQPNRTFQDMIAQSFLNKKNFIFAIVTFLDQNKFKELEKE